MKSLHAFFIPCNFCFSGLWRTAVIRVRVRSLHTFVFRNLTLRYGGRSSNFLKVSASIIYT